MLDTYRHRLDFVCSNLDTYGVLRDGSTFTYHECGRLHSTLGKCSVRFDPDTGKATRIRITLAKRFLGAQGFRLHDTLIHESAHAIQAYHYGPQVFRTRGHGYEWQRLMVELGAEPAVTHPVTVSMALRMPKNKLIRALRCAPDLDIDKVNRAYLDGVTHREFLEGCQLGYFTRSEQTL